MDDTGLAVVQLPTENQGAIHMLLERAHAHIGQLDLKPRERSLTARNYNSAINALADFLFQQPQGQQIPTKRNLERWRDDMRSGRIRGPNGELYSPRTINARLSAARKLLSAVADEIVDLQLRLAIREWATVADVKLISEQDRTGEDFGRRLEIYQVQELIRSTKSHHKGLRDRAILALGFGAGLRISEVVKLTYDDVFATRNAAGQPAINVRDSKHGKSRKVVMPDEFAWALRAVQAYVDSLPPTVPRKGRIFHGVKAIGADYAQFKPTSDFLTKSGAGAIYYEYGVEYKGEWTHLSSHDARRTYAYLCKRNGMSWEALMLQLGHASIDTTMRYVGTDIDWSERMLRWSIDL